MKLSLTYSAYREMEQIPLKRLRPISDAIIELSENLPKTPKIFGGNEGCYFIEVGDHYIIYHLDGKEVTVLGVLPAEKHTVH